MQIIAILIVFGPMAIAHYFMFKNIITSINNQDNEWKGTAMMLGFIWLGIIAAFFGIGGETNCAGMEKYCL